MTGRNEHRYGEAIGINGIALKKTGQSEAARETDAAAGQQDQPQSSQDQVARKEPAEGRTGGRDEEQEASRKQKLDAGRGRVPDRRAAVGTHPKRLARGPGLNRSIRVGRIDDPFKEDCTLLNPSRPGRRPGVEVRRQEEAGKHESMKPGHTFEGRMERFALISCAAGQGSQDDETTGAGPAESAGGSAVPEDEAGSPP